MTLGFMPSPYSAVPTSQVSILICPANHPDRSRRAPHPYTLTLTFPDIVTHRLSAILSAVGPAKAEALATAGPPSSSPQLAEDEPRRSPQGVDGYPLAKTEGSKVVWLRVAEKENEMPKSIHVSLDGRSGTRIRELDFDLTPVPVSTRTSKGLLVTKWSIKEVKVNDLSLK